MKNYSQVEAKTAARDVLAGSSIRELRHLRVDQDANMIRLSGNVRSFYHKQMAQEVVRSVAGGLKVENRVSVAS